MFGGFAALAFLGRDNAEFFAFDWLDGVFYVEV